MVICSMYSAMYKLITFDVTGTLLKFKKPVSAIYADAGKRFGINADETMLSDGFKMIWTFMNKQHPNFGLHSGMGWEKWWKLVVTETFNFALNGSSSSNLKSSIDNVGSYLIDSFSSNEHWELVEGANDLLNYLKEKNVELGVISNFDPRLTRILKEIGIYNTFSFVLTSYECKFFKPHLKIFKEAELLYSKKTGEEFDPSLSLHVGNNYEKDILGANRAGWKAALISQDPMFHSHKSDEFLVFPTLKSLNYYFHSYYPTIRN